MSSKVYINAAGDVGTIYSLGIGATGATSFKAAGISIAKSLFGIDSIGRNVVLTGVDSIKYKKEFDFGSFLKGLIPLKSTMDAAEEATYNDIFNPQIGRLVKISND